jgi:hypothetical protein
MRKSNEKVKNSIIIMIKKLLLLALLGSLFNACRESDTPSVGNDQGSVPLSISGVSVTDSLVKTRAELASVSDIGVFRLAANGYTVQNNMEYKNTVGTWAAADNNNRILLGSSDATLCTYAPYSSSVTDFTSVPMNSGVYSASTDLCYDNKSGVNFSNIGSGVSFSMKHAYAELTLNLTRDLTLTSTGNVNSITISGAASSGKLNISSGAMTSVTSGNVLLSGTPLCTVASSSVTRTVEVLMVPTSVSSSGLTFSLNVDGIDRICTVPSSQISTLEGGRNYSVNINIFGTQPESNSYIVSPGGTICIPVSRATAGNAANFPSGSAFSCGLLWSDVSATHVTTSVAGRYIKVTAGSSEGNSVVYARNSSNQIVWSWHIWVTGYVPNTTTVNYNGRVWMDRNLGAKTNGTNATAYGLYYQWGRKDPFPSGANATTMLTTYGSAPATIVSGPVSLTYSIQNPNKFYTSSSGNYDWLSPQRSDLWYNSGKTIYDPCPDGWRVPLNTEFSGLFPDNTLSGFWLYDGILSNATTGGGWWSGVIYGLYAYNLFSNGNVYNIFLRAYGFSVRCIKN